MLAFARHATSKLAGVGRPRPRSPTLGFRGEALPSIAAAGAVRLVTRRADDAAAVAVEADAQRRARRRTGRRAAGHDGRGARSLRDDAGAAQVPAHDAAPRSGTSSTCLTRLAVACPETGFRLEHDGREVVALSAGRAICASASAQVLGAERAGAMHRLRRRRRTALSLTAFLGPPRESLSTTRLVWTFVSLAPRPGRPAARRWVRDRLLLARRARRLRVAARCAAAIRSAMLFLATCARRARRQRAPGEARGALPPAAGGAPADRVRRCARRLRRGARPAGGDVSPLVPRGRGVDAARTREPAARGAQRTAPAPAAPARSRPPGRAGRASGSRRRAGLRGAALRRAGASTAICSARATDRVVLIDQHAAHERVRFERLRGRACRAAAWRATRCSSPRRSRSPPVRGAPRSSSTSATLAAVGLEGEPFGDGTFLLRTVPRLLRGQDVGRARARARGRAGRATAPALEPRAARSTRVLATIACHSAVRVGQRLGPEQVRALLDAMDGGRRERALPARPAGRRRAVARRDVEALCSAR